MVGEIFLKQLGGIAMCKKCVHKYVVRTWGFPVPRAKFFQGDESAFEAAKDFFMQQERAELRQVLMGPNGPYERKLLGKK